MSLRKADSVETILRSILSDHFENAENPHETICRIWSLLNADPASDSLTATVALLSGRNKTLQ
jgi:hypothetical protein